LSDSGQLFCNGRLFDFDLLWFILIAEVNPILFLLGLAQNIMKLLDEKESLLFEVFILAD
jgi:hypothetical protein